MTRSMGVAVLALVPAAVAAQVVTEMTPERVREAIAFGTSQNEPPYYEIRERGFFGSLYKPRLGSFTTPFLRVALAAYQAKKLYKPFAEDFVPKEILAPELHIFGVSQAMGTRIANVQAIVITPKGRHDPADAIRPTSSTQVPIQYRNLMGWLAEDNGLMAVFPLEALRQSNEVHIIYDLGVHHGGESKFCKDCFMLFKLDRIR